jgi:hypothetical protein
MSAELERGHCRSCDAPIIWATTPTGKAMPIDAEPVEGGNVVIFDGPEGPLAVVTHASQAPDKARYRAHFASCPNASQHRKQRKQRRASP